MKYLSILLFVASVLYAQCPLGFTPDESCTADNPSCGLFVDDNGDLLCDNPGPQSQPEPEEPEEIIPSDPVPDPVVVEEEEEVVTDPFCPLNLSPQEACSQENARCTFYTDSNGDSLCDNPGPQPAPPAEETEHVESENEQFESTAEPVQAEEETMEQEPDVEGLLPVECPLGFTVDEACLADDPLCTLFRDLNENTVCDNARLSAAETVEPEETHSPQSRNYCPLGYTVDEGCDVENPACAFFVDSDGDNLCDNPDPEPSPGAICTESIPQDIQTPTVIGCPLGLPPAAACPDSLALCPHWYGVSSNTACSNPPGGSRRINIILLTLAVFLPLSTWLSRKFYGRRLKDRLKRNSAHHIVRGVSLMILGFGVQGCFCPLGTFQYAFTAEGLEFLGLSGILIFLLPLVFSAFFGRVFCGWVCPFGALQEFLYRIHVPGRFSLSGRVHSKLRHLSKLILFALITVILLNRFDVISLQWSVPFCSIDPFHTIFTLFLSGSLIVAGITIILAIFVRRFFCKYLCFYGAALSFLARLTLWNRIEGIRAVEPEIDSDEEFDK